jgi:flagellum-specific ATP synthase
VSVLSAEIERIASADPMGFEGRVASVSGLSVLVDDLPLPVGATVRIGVPRAVLGEVTGFSGGRSAVMTYGGLDGVRPGAPVSLDSAAPLAGVGDALLGRVVNGLGEPIDGKGGVRDLVPRLLNASPIGAMERARVIEPIRTGVRAIDLMTPMGKGQRMGIFAGPGVGKSTLLGQIARGTSADVSVIALIGERGREVPEFIHDALGESGLARSVIVVATSDESPLVRLRAARYACAAAEHFRDSGRDVLLMMDSVTRFAHARRQVGLSVGEPPSTRGYTPSVFAELPVLLERAGSLAAGGAGSITGLYTILVEGDDMTEPIADAARGILDGHLMLSRKLAQKGHYPAIDVLDSVSRVAMSVADATHRAAMTQVGRMLALYREVEELVRIGAYARGADAETDTAIDMAPEIEHLLRQSVDERAGFDRARSELVRVAMESGERVRRLREQAGAARNGGRR